MIRREFLKKLGQLGIGAYGLSYLRFCGNAGKTVSPNLLSFSVKYPQTAWTMGVVDPNITGTFKIMSWESAFQFEKWNLIIDKFFKTYYPKIKVQLDWGISFANYNMKLPVLLAGGSPPDLVWMHDTRVKSFSSIDLLQKLDPFIEFFKPDGWPNEYYATQVEEFQYDNCQYGFPYDYATGGLYVNLDMYKKIDEELPTENWTFDDLLRVGKKLTKGNRQFGLNLGSEASAEYQYWVLRSFGGDWFNADLTESKFNLPETIEAYQWMSDLRWKHKVAPVPELTQGRPQPFVDGVIAINFDLGATEFSDLLETKFNWTIAPTPRGNKGRFQFIGGSALSIPQKAAHKHIAYELIRYMLSNPENLKIIGKMGRMFVSRMSLYEYGLPQGKSAQKLSNYKKVFYDLARRDGIAVPFISKYQEWEDIYRRNTELLYFGEELNAKKVCLKLHDATNRFLESANSKKKV
ncbi:MAG: sugar ABC transporter substrate-binding protein [Candidatus Neomarinimicrobiota bacterium]